MNTLVAEKESNAGARLPNMAGTVCGVLWILAYIFTIFVGFRDHSYGIPLVAVCMNLSWELVFSVLIPQESKLNTAITLLWLGLDCVVLCQLLRWGRVEQMPQLRPYFFIIVAGTLMLSTIGYLTFQCTFHDPEGHQEAYINNLVMSILFVFLFFSRPGMHGLSLAVFGTTLLFDVIYVCLMTQARL